MPRRPSPKVAALVKSLSEPSQDLESLVAAVSAEAAGRAALAASDSEAANGHGAGGSKSAAGSRRKTNVRPWSSELASPTESKGNSPPAVLKEEPPADQTSSASAEGESQSQAATEPRSSAAGAVTLAGPEAAAEQQQSSPARSRRRLSGGITRSPPGRSRFAAEAQASRRPSWSDPELTVPQLVRSEPAGVAGSLAEAAQAVVGVGTVGERVEQGSNGWRVPGGGWREGLRG